MTEHQGWILIFVTSIFWIEHCISAMFFWRRRIVDDKKMQKERRSVYEIKLNGTNGLPM